MGESTKFKGLVVEIYETDDDELLVQVFAVKIATEDEIKQTKNELSELINTLLNDPEMDNFTLAESIEKWLDERGWLCPELHVLEKWW